MRVDDWFVAAVSTLCQTGSNMLMPTNYLVIPSLSLSEVESGEFDVDSLHVVSDCALEGKSLADSSPDSSEVSLEKYSIVKSALARTRIGELKRVRVEVDAASVTLRGNVSSFYLKQLAQESIRSLALGLSIRNELSVV
jgi:hypothetical protein